MNKDIIAKIALAIGGTCFVLGAGCTNPVLLLIGFVGLIGAIAMT